MTDPESEFPVRVPGSQDNPEENANTETENANTENANTENANTENANTENANTENANTGDDLQDTAKDTSGYDSEAEERREQEKRGPVKLTCVCTVDPAGVRSVSIIQVAWFYPRHPSFTHVFYPPKRMCRTSAGV